MNCNFFVLGIFLSALFICVNGNVECYHNNSKEINDIGAQSYCIYAQLEDGTDIQHCEYDAWYKHDLPPWPESEMGECVKAPGYLKFMRCDTDWCNTGCEFLEPTTTTEVEITTEHTTFSTTREEIITRQTSKVLETSTMFAATKIAESAGQNKSSGTSSHNANEAGEKENLTRSSAFARSTTVQTPTGKRASTTTSVTISQTTGTCSKDSELDSRKPDANNDQNGEIQGIRTFGKGQMGNNHSYRPNNCNCRCEHKREQNTFVVINNAASFNIVTTFVTAFVYLF